MPATLEARPRERVFALAAVALIQLGLGLALLIGLRVDVAGRAQTAEELIAIVLSKPPPPPPPQAVHRAPRAEQRPSSASAPAPTPRPIPNPQPPHTPRIALRPTALPTAGGNGAGEGAAVGTGLGNAGSGGTGAGEGGTDLVQIAGSIDDSDMPRQLRDARFRGRVSFVFTVEPSGRADRCSVTRSSGMPELDQLTCRLIEQRFRYRPSTDRNGRPIAEEVDGDEDWGAR